MTTSIIVDHDLGTNPDDFFALQMLLHHPNADVKLLISGNGYPLERAKMASRILELNSRSDIPNYVGEELGISDFYCKDLINEFKDEFPRDYVYKIKEVVDSCGEVTYLAIQGLSNLAHFLQKYPDYADHVKIVHMGLGTIGYEEFSGGPTNMKVDMLAAKYVYENFKVWDVGSHTTIKDSMRVNPSSRIYQLLQHSTNPVHKLLMQHVQDYYQRRSQWPVLHDPLTASVAVGEQFVSFEDIFVEFNELGEYKKGTATKVLSSKVDCDVEGFLDMLVSHLG